MKTAFDMDNPFFSLMGKLADYVILNLLFLLTAWPVVTIGPALGAMHQVLPKMAEGTEGALCRTYIQAFIRNFRRMAGVWLLLLVSGAVLCFDMTAAADILGEGVQRVVLPVAGSLLLFWLLIFSWIFLMPEGPERKLWDRIRAALFMAVRNLPVSLLMIGIEILPVVCYLFFIRFFLGILLPFYVCAGFSLSGALCSILAGRTKLKCIEKKRKPT